MTKHAAKYLILFFMLSSCGVQKKVDKVISTIDLTTILSLRDSRLEEIKQDQDVFGWVHTDKCDAALFSGLLKGSGLDVNLIAGVDGGRMYRTPYKDCYYNEVNNVESSRRSKSTISSDMIIGYLFGFYFNGQTEEIEKIRRFSKANSWIVGEGDLSRITVKPNLQKTIYLAAGKTYGGLQPKWFGSDVDTDRHVIAINIALQGEIEGRIDGDALAVIEGFSRQDDKNTLFHYIKHLYTDGDQSETIDLAIEQYYQYPRGNRCVRWLWERHNSKWNSCKETEWSTGGEIVVLAKLLELSQK